ncbi:MAG TPA: (2Fe-2S)-binding protein [Bryobacteraceae bacterium]|nr:(2Fe-2S)-binding protein [Bryobacteraceae bacterium]
MSIKDPEAKKPGSGFSRRGFLQGVGVGGGALSTGVLENEAQAQTPANVISGETAITLQINGKPYKTTVEPRRTLLDVMRDQLDLTAAKRVCDRGTCGACTVIVDNKAMYSCTVLAIDAQGKKIETLEGIAQGRNPHPIVNAFVANDAQQCGYCTPGFVVASKAFLDRNPSPTFDQVKEGLGGNLCRCGTYVGIRKAVLEASAKLKGGR